MTPPLPTGAHHLVRAQRALAGLHAELDRIDRWAGHVAGVLTAGGRLLAAGNGGSAAEAQHLCSELVGRYRDERIPLSAIALTSEASSVTAIANDYGFEEVFARQVRAHGRQGDVLVALSTSGRSPNVVAAVGAGREVGLVTWALTGRAPNPLAVAAHDAVCVDAEATATVQEAHLVLVHLLCAGVDAILGAGAGAGAGAGTVAAFGLDARLGAGAGVSR